MSTSPLPHSFFCLRKLCGLLSEKVCPFEIPILNSPRRIRFKALPIPSGSEERSWHLQGGKKDLKFLVDSATVSNVLLLRWAIY